MGETDGEQVPRGKDEKDFEKRVKECLKLSEEADGGGDASRRMRNGAIRTGGCFVEPSHGIELQVGHFALKWMAEVATYTNRRGKSQASMSRRAAVAAKPRLRPGEQPPVQILVVVANIQMRTLKVKRGKGIRLKFQNQDVAVDGNVRESGDVGGNSGKSYRFCLTACPPWKRLSRGRVQRLEEHRDAAAVSAFSRP
ncbi:hypothetical protein Bca52824_080276 [Brassica carinata]|uniref:Uncharacterized protein n=1 Tax=Brassica carinata TaxID=52824 RepID=A0A8X7TPX1_BRACI|nr:hypothetical protein Bca52824_080276 [Brassica carinata]